MTGTGHVVAVADAPRRFPISFEPWYRGLSTVALLPPSTAYVEVAGDEVAVRMGWAFRARFPRTSVVAVSEPDLRTISRGVHGFAGRWLVNGSGKGIVSLRLEPPPRGRVLGIPVQLRELLVSVEEPAALADALQR